MWDSDLCHMGTLTGKGQGVLHITGAPGYCEGTDQVCRKLQNGIRNACSVVTGAKVPDDSLWPLGILIAGPCLPPISGVEVVATWRSPPPDSTEAHIDGDHGCAGQGHFLILAVHWGSHHPAHWLGHPELWKPPSNRFPFPVSRSRRGRLLWLSPGAPRRC